MTAENSVNFKKYIIWLYITLILSLFVHADSHLPPGVLKLIEYERQLSLSVNFLIAFLAGLVSITSPCGFAILPTFFAFAFKDKKKSMAMTVAFSIGMLIAFTIFGFIAGLLGNFLNKYKLAFAESSGYLLILFGIMLLLNKGFSIFNFKLNSYNKKGLFGIASLGFLFGIAWTPCVGPILVGILVLAANTASALMGTLSLLFYGLGVITPLIILAHLSDKYNLAEKKFFQGKIFSFKLFNKKFEIHSYNLIGGLLLILIGISIVKYKGTFFFQTTMTDYLPWTMAFWGYLNEKILGLKILTSTVGNIVGIIIAILLVIFIFRYLAKKGKSRENEK